MKNNTLTTKFWANIYNKYPKEKLKWHRWWVDIKATDNQWPLSNDSNEYATLYELPDGMQFGMFLDYLSQYPYDFAGVLSDLRENYDY